MVTNTSIKVAPVGLAKLLLKISITETIIPVIVCPINLGNGARVLISSHRPIMPMASAGAISDVISQKLLKGLREKSKDV